ncbi:MAG TPA: trimeric intracellular cation channel family protein [Gemmatimonadales bacterium]|nr:trimeric intracellular cation channel family protein [Gemmatimonadales bacterium]
MPLRYDPALILGFIVVLDLAGTFVFALSGAMTGVRHRLDLFGVLVLSFAAGNAGGITRDLLLGATPPPAIADWRYIGVSLAAALVTFYFARIIDRLRSPVLVLDAAGLALFAVSGTLKALATGLNPLGAMMLGVLTGVGGGMLRDVLVSEVPAVLRGEVYASAALAGAAVVVAARLLRLPTPTGATAGAVLCFALRYVAIRRGWQLPVADRPRRRATDRPLALPSDRTTARDAPVPADHAGDGHTS